MAINSAVMRNIAGCEIDKLFPGLAEGPRTELVTSVIRQWLTNEGWAGLFTIAVNYWLNLIERNGKALAGVMVHPSEIRRRLKTWLVDEADLPGIVHQLSLSQSATFVNAANQSVRVSTNPKEHSISFDELKDDY